MGDTAAWFNEPEMVRFRAVAVCNADSDNRVALRKRIAGMSIDDGEMGCWGGLMDEAGELEKISAEMDAILSRFKDDRSGLHMEIRRRSPAWCFRREN